MKKVILSLAFLSTMAMLQLNAGEQFAMSDADRAMYKEMLENNPAEIYVEEGGEILEDSLGGEEALAKFLGISEKDLPKYIAGFPRYIKKLGNVVGIDQVLQAMEVEQGKKKTKLKSGKMFSMLAYVKSLANDELIGIDVDADEHIKAAYALGKKIINLEEEERKRISRELHDGIIQVLISIKYSIEATGMSLKRAQHEKPVQLQQAEKNLSAAIGEVRRISHNLHPMILDELGFSAAVTTLGIEFSERTGIDVKVIKPSVRKLLPDYINITLYRVVQESLTNIEKYAQASEVVIELSMTKKWLKLSITDNGKGFDVAGYLKGNKLGIGLRNLAERVEYHSGEFEFKSSSAGTIIIAKIPKISFVNHFNNTVVKDVNS